MPGADPFGPHFTHYHSEGQPPYRPRSGSRPITASGKEGLLPRDPLYYTTKHLQHFTAAERNQSHQGLHLRADRWPRHILAIGMPIALTPSSLAETTLHHSFINDDTEPPRVSRRLQLLRGWSHDEASSPVFPRGPCPRGSDGPGPPRRARLAMGGDPLDCREDRLLGRDTASLGAAGRA